MNKITTLITMGLCCIGMMQSCSSNDDIDAYSSQLSGSSNKGEVPVRSVIDRDSNVNVPGIRTSFVGTFPNETQKSVVFYWEPNDEVWLENGNHAAAYDVNNSTQAITEKATNAVFTFAEGSFPNYTGFYVYYPGSSAQTYNSVTIATTQKQDEPNNTTHLAVAGDAGVGYATKANDKWSFTLEHKSSYLCFLPIMQSATFKLRKIKVTAESTNIAGTYTLSASGLEVVSGSNSITLNTGDFSISTTADQATNAAYMVIAPGTHTLTVEYTIVGNASGTQTTITKKLVAQQYDANTVYTINDPLTDIVYSTNYYPWDVQEPYNFLTDGTMTVGSGDTRYYNNISTGEATNTLASAATKDEMLQLITYSNLYWDETFYWELPGVGVYKGGMWFLRPSLQGSSKVNTVTTTSGAYNVTNITIGRPDDVTQYFYLPALGYIVPQFSGINMIYSASPTNIGTVGSYWSKTTYNGDKAWTLTFKRYNTSELNTASIQLDRDQYKYDALRRFDYSAVQ